MVEWKDFYSLCGTTSCFNFIISTLSSLVSFRIEAIHVDIEDLFRHTGLLANFSS